MADRFYSEGSKNNGAAGTDANAGSPRPENINPYSKIPTKPLGDFSENIDSNNTAKRGYSQPQKKFEVHINDFDDFVGIPEPPATPKAPTPISQSNAPAKRPVPPTAPRAKTVSGDKVPTQMPKRPTAATQAKTKQYVPSNERKAVYKRPTEVQEKQKKDASKKQVPTEIQNKIKAKKRYNFVKTALIACVCIFFISIMTVTASTIAMQFINDVLVIDKQGGSVSVEIPEGSDFDTVFNILEENNLIKQKNLCYLLLKIRDYDTMEYQSGIYLLDKDAGVEINIETIMLKKSGTKGTVRLTFPEGWSIAQIFEKLERYEVCTAEKLYANLELVGKQYSFIKEIKDDSNRYLKYEGYLFPDTYDFFIDENPASVLKKLFNNFDNKWTAEYDARAKELGLTIDEVMNIAAMIQREAKDTSQMYTISSIVHNRLASPSTYPTLEMNSTKDYISSLESYNLFSDFYYELYLSSYNTYSSQGLPPGPICNPGASAIKAALYPADTDYYFFMHSPSGVMYVARTASEHHKNTQLYLYG
jgi:UPF0755 protein